MKRFLINVYTNWCGEDNTFSAIAEDIESSGLIQAAEEASYNNFNEYGGIDGIMEELYPEALYYTSAMYDEALSIEKNYYGYEIEEWDDERDEEEWSWYELVYDKSNGTEFVSDEKF